MDAGCARAADGLQGANAARVGARPQDARPLLVGLGIRPVVVVARPATGGQAGGERSDGSYGSASSSSVR